MLVLKKRIPFILSSCILLGLFACSNQNEQAKHNDNQFIISNNEEANEEINNDVREVVWKQLSSEQKEWIDGTWKDGKVSKVTLNENYVRQVGNKSYEGKEVYLIDFPIKSKSIPNNMIVYADVNNFDYIGNGFVD